MTRWEPAPDNRMRVDNTLEGRLELMQSLLQRVVAERLFTGVSIGKFFNKV